MIHIPKSPEKHDCAIESHGEHDGVLICRIAASDARRQLQGETYRGSRLG